MNARILPSVLFAWAIATAISPAIARAELRALVIGNGDYKNFAKLATPANDAATLKRSFETRGFTVKKITDSDHAGMVGAIKKFGQGLGPEDTAVVCFSGYGMTVGETSYLLPVDANAGQQAQVRDRAVSVDWLIQEMDRGGRGAATKIVILDASRRHPLGGSLVAPKSLPAGTLLCFSARPGFLSPADQGEYSVYTKALGEHLPGRGAFLAKQMHRVAEQVRRKTGQRQIPWTKGNLKDDFVMMPEAGSGKPRLKVVKKTPVAELVPGKETVVFSPYLEGKKVSIEGFVAGDKVECPWSGKPFLVPESRKGRPGPEVAKMLPLAKRVPGDRGIVFSPYAKGKKIRVDGLAPGAKAECPYTGKMFLVPE